MKSRFPARFAAVLACLAAAAAAPAGRKLIQAKDPAGDEVRAAVTRFLTDLADGDEKKVRAEFAGDERGRALLDKYLRALSASRRLRAAVRAKFGDAPRAAGLAVVEEDIRGYVRAIPVETIIVDDDSGSMSPGSGFLLGVDLRRVGGVWKFTCPTALDGESEKRLNLQLDAATAASEAVADRVEKGELKSFADAEAAFGNKYLSRPGVADPAPGAPSDQAPTSRPAPAGRSSSGGN